MYVGGCLTVAGPHRPPDPSVRCQLCPFCRPGHSSSRSWPAFIPGAFPQSCKGLTDTSPGRLRLEAGPGPSERRPPCPLALPGLASCPPTPPSPPWGTAYWDRCGLGWLGVESSVQNGWVARECLLPLLALGPMGVGGIVSREQRPWSQVGTWPGERAGAGPAGGGERDMHGG